MEEVKGDAGFCTEIGFDEGLVGAIGKKRFSFWDFRLN